VASNHQESDGSVAAAVEHDSRELFALSVRALEAHDVELPPSGLRALLVLDDIGTCTLGELADQLALSQSATSRMVDKLVTRRLIDRHTATEDRRRVTLAATGAGRRVTARLVRRRSAAITSILNNMAPEDRNQLQTGLKAFAAAARHSASTGPAPRTATPSRNATHSA
jgi:DNA-binding MarR family transcriptional regulator